MSIIFGLLTLVVSILLPSAILYFTEFELLHFSMFFIIPVGAIVIGYICGYGYYKGLFLSNKYISKIQIVIGVILSVICMFGIEYVCYQFIRIDPVTNEMIYGFTGDHISNYYLDDFGQLTFFNYIRFKIENTPISFSYKARSIGTVSNPIICWIFNIIDYLGVTLGVIFAALYQKRHEYCHTCKLYKKKKQLFEIPLSEGAEYIQKLEEAKLSNDSSEKISSLLNSYHGDNGLKKQEHYDCEMIYCSSCRTAKLCFTRYMLNSKKQIEKDNSYEYSLDIDYDCARRFI